MMDNWKDFNFCSLGRLDQKILTLRHRDELSNGEAARVLDVSPAMASRLYARAIQRLTSKIGSRGGAFQPFATPACDCNEASL